MPIGTEENPFSGHYNGNGHSIYGMKAVSLNGDSAAGLFGYTDGARIYDISVRSVPGHLSYAAAVSVADSSLRLNTETVRTVAGGIVGIAGDTEVISCYVDCIVVSAVLAIPSHRPLYATGSAEFNVYVSAGGIAGCGAAVIKNCVSSGSVYAFSMLSIANDGGIPSFGGSPMVITVSGKVTAGGIAGDMTSVSIRNTMNTASVNSAWYIRTDIVGAADIVNEPELMLHCSAAAGGIAGGGITKADDICNYGPVTSILDVLFLNGFRTEPSENVSSIIAAGCSADAYETVVTNFYGGGPLRTGGGEDIAAVRTVPVIDDRYSNNTAEWCYYIDDGDGTGFADDALIEGAVPVRGHASLNENTFEEWDFYRIWNITDDGPKIWLRYDIMIVDTSGTFDGRPGYSLDREHDFDNRGNLYSYADTSGFSITLADEREGSQIKLYMIENGTVITLNKDTNDNYIIPRTAFLDVTDTITVYMDGLKLVIVPKETDMTAIAVLSVLMVSVIAVTIINAIAVNLTIAGCAKAEMKRKENDERT
jgi:hypothetical protein